MSKTPAVSRVGKNGIRTVHLRWQGEEELDIEQPLVALGRTGEQLVLIVADEDARDDRPDGAFVSALSVIVPQDPFPRALDGRQMIWVKNYAENVGIVPQLEHAGFLRTTGTTIARGFTTLPLAVVQLDETEIAQNCALCTRWESTGTEPRFKRCSSCKRRYYCSTEHQHAHWKQHKRDCKDLANMRFADVENRRRGDNELPSSPASPETPGPPSAKLAALQLQDEA